MTLEEELGEKIEELFLSSWNKRDGEAVPEPEDIRLGNDGVQLTATVLYADLAESTELVDTEEKTFAAEIYKAYLHCAAKIISAETGEITAYDGDRIMAVFLGEAKNSHAVRAALKINYVVREIINTKLDKCYEENSYELTHGIGIDTSDILVARTGIRGSNDLVWVGRAANYAAKLCGMRNENYLIYITEKVYRCTHSSVRYADGTDMWEPRIWTRNGKRIYRSAYCWNCV